jgi:hypothetical protein
MQPACVYPWQLACSDRYERNDDTLSKLCSDLGRTLCRLSHQNVAHRSSSAWTCNKCSCRTTTPAQQCVAPGWGWAQTCRAWFMSGQIACAERSKANQACTQAACSMYSGLENVHEVMRLLQRLLKYHTPSCEHTFVLQRFVISCFLKPASASIWCFVCVSVTACASIQPALSCPNHSFLCASRRLPRMKTNASSQKFT